MRDELLSGDGMWLVVANYLWPESLFFQRSGDNVPINSQGTNVILCCSTFCLYINVNVLYLKS